MVRVRGRARMYHMRMIESTVPCTPMAAGRLLPKHAHREALRPAQRPVHARPLHHREITVLPWHVPKPGSQLFQIHWFYEVLIKSSLFCKFAIFIAPVTRHGHEECVFQFVHGPQLPLAARGRRDLGRDPHQVLVSLANQLSPGSTSLRTLPSGASYHRGVTVIFASSAPVPRVGSCGVL